jgi:hypothetical protein
MDGRREEVGSVGSEYESVSNECKKEDVNCDDSEAETDNRIEDSEVSDTE